jgi:hypothetical protein
MLGAYSTYPAVRSHFAWYCGLRYGPKSTAGAWWWILWMRFSRSGRRLPGARPADAVKRVAVRRGREANGGRPPVKGREERRAEKVRGRGVSDVGEEGVVRERAGQERRRVEGKSA